MFCDEEMARENLDFWVDATAFQRIESQGEREKKFMEMYGRYFDEGCSCEVNVSGMWVGLEVCLVDLVREKEEGFFSSW